ncbi:bZIP transcription factor [Rhodosporidium toruloides NP11] [Rhodotorula toruloides]|nr:bZIP transcription factor [Rhodosporidium toruloides NP11] [Rhodotorula toruloides]
MQAGPNSLTETESTSLPTFRLRFSSSFPSLAARRSSTAHSYTSTSGVTAVTASSEKAGPVDLAVDDPFSLLPFNTLPDPSAFLASLEIAGAPNPPACSLDALTSDTSTFAFDSSLSFLSTFDHAASSSISADYSSSAADLQIFQPPPLPAPSLASPNPLDFLPSFPPAEDALDFSLFATPSNLPTNSTSTSSTSPSAANTTASPSSSTFTPAALTPASYLAEQAARSAPTGIRDPCIPRIALDAPVQKRDSLLPSATSRKRLNAAGERKLAAKRRKEQHATSESSASPRGGGVPGAVAGAEEGEEVPQDALTATERKRLQNTLSARRCRARKQARVQELEVENAALRERVERLEAMLRLAWLLIFSSPESAVLVEQVA